MTTTRHHTLDLRDRFRLAVSDLDRAEWITDDSLLDAAERWTTSDMDSDDLTDYRTLAQMLEAFVVLHLAHPEEGDGA